MGAKSSRGEVSLFQLWCVFVCVVIALLCSSVHVSCVCIIVCVHESVRPCTHVHLLLVPLTVVYCIEPGLRLSRLIHACMIEMSHVVALLGTTPLPRPPPSQFVAHDILSGAPAARGGRSRHSPGVALDGARDTALQGRREKLVEHDRPDYHL